MPVSTVAPFLTRFAQIYKTELRIFCIKFFSSCQQEGSPQCLDNRPLERRRTGRLLKGLIGRIQSWGRNRSFIGLILWPEEEEDKEIFQM